MNKLVSDSMKWVREFKQRLPSALPADVVVVPPFTLLNLICSELQDYPISLGAQNVSSNSCGAFTGEISNHMLHDSGCRYVLIGHSERRNLYGETNSVINEKIKAALNLKVIFCLGESEEQRRKGLTQDVVGIQLEQGLKGLTSQVVEGLAVAYEPVWAIGTGENASPEQAQEVHKFIRGELTKIFNKEMAERIRILYGGSVKSDISASLLAETDINGLLVGSASLNAEEFCAIIESAG